MVINMLAEVLSIDARVETVFDVAIGVVADIVVGDSVGMLIDVKVIVLDAAGIELELAIPVSYVVVVLADAWAEAVFNVDVLIDVRVKMLIIDVLTGVLVGTIVGAVSDFSIVALVEVTRENVLTTVMTASLEEPLCFC